MDINYLREVGNLSYTSRSIIIAVLYIKLLHFSPTAAVVFWAPMQLLVIITITLSTP